MDHSVLERFGNQSRKENGAGTTGPIFLSRAGPWELILLAVGRRKRFKIENRSMLPLLAPGQEVLAKPSSQCPVHGEIWILHHPERTDLKIVKLVTGSVDDGFAVVGLNKAFSEDSRHFGIVGRDHFLSRVVSRFL